MATISYFSNWVIIRGCIFLEDEFFFLIRVIKELQEVCVLN